MSTFNAPGPVFFRQDVLIVGELTPPISFAIDTFDDVDTYYQSELVTTIPISNPTKTHGDTYPWVSNVLSVPTIFEPLGRVRKMKVSWNLVVQDAGYPANTPNINPLRMTLSGNKILNTGLSTETDLKNFRGFKWHTELHFADMTAITVKTGGHGSGSDVEDEDPSLYTDPILVLDIGHLTSAAQDLGNDSTAQAHSYLTGGVFWFTERYFALGDLYPGGGTLYPYAAKFNITMTPDSGRKLFGTEEDDVVNGVNGHTTITGSIQIEPAVGEANAFWGYDGRFNTTTGAPI